MIRLGGTHRPPGTRYGEGVPPTTTPSLLALERAEARAKALSAQAAGKPRDGGAGGVAGAERGKRGRGRLLRPAPALPRLPRGPAKPRGRRPSLTRAGGRSRRRAHGSSRRRPLARLAAGVAVILAVLVVVAGAAVVVQLTRPVPARALRAAAPQRGLRVPGPAPVLAWPLSGEAAVAVPGVGLDRTAGPSTPVPIASLAKVMTAYVVLRDHPLAMGQNGPAIRITAADQATYEAEQAANDSVAPVIAGESLTELQLLQALLIPSADNVCPILAHWDAGTNAAFVAKMNAAAVALGMKSTHYADASGISSATQSTAADELRLAEAVAVKPVLMSIVRQPDLVLPGSLLLTGYNSLLGHDGIVGIKTGSTGAAGGCFMFATSVTAGGLHEEVLGVVLGQYAPRMISAALEAGRALARSAAAALHSVSVVAAGSTVGEVTSAWDRPVPVTTTKAVTVLGYGGMAIEETVHPRAGVLPRSLPAGYEVATVTVRAGGQVDTVAAVTSRASVGPPLRWRLRRV